MLVRSSLTSRDSLFFVIFLALSCPDELGMFASVVVYIISSHHNNITNVIITAFSSHILRGSCPHFSRHVVPVGVLFWSVLVVTLGCESVVDDPP